MPSSLNLPPSLAGTAPAAPAASTAPLAPAPLPVIRVVLADSHALMRRSLRLLLDREQEVEVVGEAGDLASVVRHVEGDRPQVLLLDLSMPGGSSVETIGQLRKRAPATQVVALTMEDDPVFAQRAFAAGAIGFVMTERSDAELLQAIRAAARGEEYISPQVAPRLEAMRRRLRRLRGGVPAAGR
jgi:two-component system response regulator NreC